MRDIVEEIWSTLRQNKLRTALTGFSVAWGIFMIISLIGAGNGVMNSVSGNISLVPNSIEIINRRTSKPYAGYKEGRYIEFDSHDVDILDEGYFGEYVEDVSAIVSETTQMVYGQYSFNCELEGVTPLYQGIDNLEIVHGRFINGNDLKGQRKVVVIGSKEADQMLEKGVKISTLVGKYLDIGGFIYKIVGIYKSDESVASFVNVTIFAPSSTVSSIYSKGNNIDGIQLTFHGLDTEEKNKEFEENYRRAFNLHHHADPTDTRTIEAYNNAVNRQRLGSVAKKIRKALWILGLLTLISGIVGISNIMLITVKERTHEFGIRKAIGARPAEILKLVIAESITITAFFGYIGMVLGIAANKIMDITMSDKAIDVGIAKATIFVNPGVSMSTAVEATLLLIIAGTIAGMIPAWKATKVKPIEALRAE